MTCIWRFQVELAQLNFMEIFDDPRILLRKRVGFKASIWLWFLRTAKLKKKDRQKLILMTHDWEPCQWSQTS